MEGEYPVLISQKYAQVNETKNVSVIRNFVCLKETVGKYYLYIEMQGDILKFLEVG